MFHVNANTKTLMIVAVVLLLIYALYRHRAAPVVVDAPAEEVAKKENFRERFAEVSPVSAEEAPAAGASDFKASSYENGQRGGTGSWDAYFDSTNQLINGETEANDNFVPMDASHNKFAGVSGIETGKTTDPEDMFDVEKLLPSEVNNDWFDVQPEPISVKNRHLINVTKPVGVNTVGSSKRNASHDLRGNGPANPKFIVSPWLQTSIEPDNNLKPMC